MVSAVYFGSEGPGFESHWRWNSAHNCMAFHCAEIFIIILPSSRYELNNVERDIKDQLIIIKPTEEKDE